MIGISDHCVEQFVARTRPKSYRESGRSPKSQDVREKILEMLRKSVIVELKPGYRANNIIKNGMRSSVFLKFSDWIFVLDSELTTVITCYPSSSLKWVVTNSQVSFGISLQHKIDGQKK